MKLFSTVLVAIIASSANGFSVTMSSIGYLDQLHTGSIHLTSFAPPVNAPSPSYSYSPAPVPAAAPAPAPYQSSFADLPASTELNYMKTLGGGNSMKGGRNFAGVSTSFKPTRSGNTYLDGMFSAGSVSVPSTFSAPVPAPAPVTYVSPMASAPASTDLNYIKTLGGGNSMKSGRNYAGVSSYFRPTSNGSTYLDALKGKIMAPPSYSAGPYAASAPAPAPTPSYSAPPPADGSYLQNLASVSSTYGSMHSKFETATSSFLGVNPKPKATRSAFGSYLDAL